MQRFKTGDRVLVLPKFAHLYSGSAGIIVDVTPDPHRPVFNEYTVEFPNGFTANAFEFQILEDYPKYELSVAVSSFDSYKQTASNSLRGSSADRRVVLETPTVDVDMKIHFTSMKIHFTLSSASVLGQISEKGTSRSICDAKVTLMKESTPLLKTTTDNFGVFKFDRVTRGTLNIDVLLQKELLRILGTFSV
jgi:hypothetical protein